MIYLAEVKWIRLSTDMFDNKKIKFLRKLPEGDSVILVWVMLLTIAGRCNSNGFIFLTENIPYDSEMLANELGMKETTVTLALSMFEKLEMISRKDERIYIVGWEEHQNSTGLDKIREQNRLRKQKQRQKEKALLPYSEPSLEESNQICDSHVTVTCDNRESHAIDKDIDKEKDINIINNIYTEKQIVDLFHDTCVSFPKVVKLSSERKKAIKARLNTYSFDEIKTVFEKAQASDFLKGKNDRNWLANFDWIMKDSNMAKILDGNYDNKRQHNTQNYSQMNKNCSNRFHNSCQRSYTADDFLNMEQNLLRRQEIDKGSNNT